MRLTRIGNLSRAECKYSGIRKIKELAEANRRLKQMDADLSLKHEVLKDVVEKGSDACRRARIGRFRPRCIWNWPACEYEILRLFRSVYHYQQTRNVICRLLRPSSVC